MYYSHFILISDRMVALSLASFKSLSFKRISIFLILLTTTKKAKSDPNKITWSGNLQFTEDGWLHPKDISDVMKEIKVKYHIRLLDLFLFHSKMPRTSSKYNNGFYLDGRSRLWECV